MPHPQNSPRGLFAKKRINFGNSTSSITHNSTGAVVGGPLYVSGLSVAAAKITANSTAITLGGGAIVTGTVVVGNQATRGLISANSTALTLPNVMKITGAHANATITANSTGIKIGTKYITTNSTGTTL
jgi:hypothetical protein